MAGMTYLMMFLILILLVVFVPLLLKRFGFPAVVSIMIIGIIVGPNALNVIGHLNQILGRNFPTSQLYHIIDAMGLLGLVFLMSLAGMEVRLNDLKVEKKAILWLTVLTFLIPAITGFFVYLYFKPSDTIGQILYASLFASHSIGIVFPVIRELKIARTRFGIAVLVSTLLTDLASLILLAITVQLKRHSVNGSSVQSISFFDKINPAGWEPLFFSAFFITLVLYIIFFLWAIPILSKFIFKKLHPKDDVRLSFYLFIVLFVVFIGELIGVNIIVGAFVAGMSIVRCKAIHANEKILHQKIEGLGYGLLIPFLFLSIGMKTDLKVLFQAWENAFIVAFTCVGLIGSKVFSGWLAMRISGFTHKKGICAGLMTIPQLSATIAAAAVAMELSIIGKQFFNAIVVLSIVTTIPVPVILKLFITRGKITFDEVKIEDPLNVNSDIEEELL